MNLKGKHLLKTSFCPYHYSNQYVANPKPSCLKLTFSSASHKFWRRIGSWVLAVCIFVSHTLASIDCFGPKEFSSYVYWLFSQLSVSVNIRLQWDFCCYIKCFPDIYYCVTSSVFLTSTIVLHQVFPDIYYCVTSSFSWHLLLQYNVQDVFHFCHCKAQRTCQNPVQMIWNCKIFRMIITVSKLGISHSKLCES